MKKSVMLRNLFVLGLFACASLPVQGQEGIIFLDSLRKTELRKHLRFPDVNGMKVIKADLHMHTVFTDGLVWPNVRAQEAWREGLDAFSFTEHAEYTPFKEYVVQDPSRPHELAKEKAKENNLTLIKGIEITRGTPPGHFNALFIEDAKAFISDNASKLDQAAIDVAVEQKAFIFWNHPGWQARSKPDSYDWIPFIEKQYQDKKLHGIEVANGFSIYTKSIDWALDRNLTLVGNSDIHNLVEHSYLLDSPEGHRTMTLIFAKDASQEAIREGLEAGRTVVWAGKYLIGKEENVKSLVEAAVELKPAHHEKNNRNNEKTKYYELANHSDLYLEFKLAGGSATNAVVLHPHTSFIITAKAGQESISYEITNTLIRSDKHLELSLSLK